MTLNFFLFPSILLLMYIFMCVLGVTTDKPCAARFMPNRSVICVCNNTYCDTITREKPAPGTYIAYTSSAAGSRFKKTFGSITSCNTTSPLTLLLYPEIKYQTIKGFGAAITDSAAINWLSLQTTQLRQRLIDAYFSSVGIEYNFLRVPIGGTDFSTHKYAYNELPKDDVFLRYFSLSYEDLHYKIPMIKSAFAVSCAPVFVLGTTWAPPDWMTEKNNYTTCGRLKAKYYQTFAEYHYKFIDQYAVHGIPVWGITTSNEPANGFLPFTKFNCLAWTAHHLGLWINHYLGPRIRGSKYCNVKILGIDDQRFTIPLWFIEMLEEYPSVIHSLDGVALHDYDYDRSPPEQLKLITNSHPDKFIMSTEFCEGFRQQQEPKVDLGSWERATTYITNIIDDLNFNVVGWLDWNICLNEEGGPTWNENYVDSPIIVAPNKGEFYKQPMFYAMGHFSKFISRGSRRIHVVEIKCETTVERPHPTSFKKSETVTHVAFLTPDDTIVVVIGNTGAPTVAQIQLRDIQFSIHIEAKSIVTVEFPYQL